MQVMPGAHREVIDTRISDLVLDLYGVTTEELHHLLQSVEPLDPAALAADLSAEEAVE